MKGRGSFAKGDRRRGMGLWWPSDLNWMVWIRQRRGGGVLPSQNSSRSAAYSPVMAISRRRNWGKVLGTLIKLEIGTGS